MVDGQHAQALLDLRDPDRLSLPVALVGQQQRQRCAQQVQPAGVVQPGSLERGLPSARPGPRRADPRAWRTAGGSSAPPCRPPCVPDRGRGAKPAAARPGPWPFGSRRTAFPGSRWPVRRDRPGRRTARKLRPTEPGPRRGCRARARSRRRWRAQGAVGRLSRRTSGRPLCCRCLRSGDGLGDEPDPARLDPRIADDHGDAHSCGPSYSRPAAANRGRRAAVRATVGNVLSFPARAGPSGAATNARRKSPVHPRARGPTRYGPSAQELAKGSSPRVRG